MRDDIACVKSTTLNVTATDFSLKVGSSLQNRGGKNKRKFCKTESADAETNGNVNHSAELEFS